MTHVSQGAITMKSVGALVCLLLFLGYYGNNVVPDEIEDKWEYFFNIALSRIVSDFSTLGSILTRTDGRIFVRWVIDALEGTFAPIVPGVKATDEMFDGVEVRVYQREGETATRGGLVFFHGGGFIAATPRGYDGFCSELVRRLNITVVSVHYRRIPEHPSPLPLEDCYKATLHFLRHAEHYGVDPGKVGVAGDSAGGTLAAAVPLYFRDHVKQFHLKFQVLIYPLLQGMDLDLPSYQLNGHRSSPFTQLWSVAGVVASLIHGLDYPYYTFVPRMLCGHHIEDSVREQYRHIIDSTLLPRDMIQSKYTKEKCQGKPDPEAIAVLQAGVLNPYNFPLMTQSVSNLPRALMVTVETDTIRDDGLLYVQRFREANIPVDHYHSISGWHGMITFHDSTNASVDATDYITQFIAKQLNVDYIATPGPVQSVGAFQYTFYLTVFCLILIQMSRWFFRSNTVKSWLAGKGL